MDGGHGCSVDTPSLVVTLREMAELAETRGDAASAQVFWAVASILDEAPQAEPPALFGQDRSARPLPGSRSRGKPD